jgi:hypothetical protein
VAHNYEVKQAGSWQLLARAPGGASAFNGEVGEARGQIFDLKPHHASALPQQKSARAAADESNCWVAAMLASGKANQTAFGANLIVRRFSSP